MIDLVTNVEFEEVENGGEQDEGQSDHIGMYEVDQNYSAQCNCLLAGRA